MRSAFPAASPGSGSARGSSTSAWPRPSWCSSSSSVSPRPIPTRRCRAHDPDGDRRPRRRRSCSSRSRGRSGAPSTWPCGRSSSRTASPPASSWPTKWIELRRDDEPGSERRRDRNDIAGRAPRPITRTDGHRPPCVSGRRLPRRLRRATRPRHAGPVHARSVAGVERLLHVRWHEHGRGVARRSSASSARDDFGPITATALYVQPGHRWSRRGRRTRVAQRSSGGPSRRRAAQ